MPTYVYHCEKCTIEYEAIKGIKEYDGKDPCPSCGKSGKRIFSCNILFNKTSINNAEYNPAFGKVIKNPKERDELAKRMGLIEIGNEKPKSIHSYFDKSRDEKIKKSWNDV